MMLRKFITYSFILFFGVVAITKIQIIPESYAAEEAADFIDYNGEFMIPSPYKGRGLMVNFWATWCEYCQIEMPEISQIQRKYRSKGLEVLTVSEDMEQDGKSEKTIVSRYMAENRLNNLPVVYDSKGKLMRLLGARGLPTTVLFNKKGEEIARVEGRFDWKSKQAREMLEEALK